MPNTTERYLDKTNATSIINKINTKLENRYTKDAVNDIVAPEFSSSTSYAVGDYVIYEGALYKCTTAHSAGAWSSGDFTQTQVVDEVGGGSDGHTIENSAGTVLTQRDTLQFKGGLSASDDSTNEVTVVDDTVPEIEWSVWNAMTPQEQEAIPNAILLNAPGGGGDTSALVNKSDITDLQLTGTTNSTGSTITSGTWFYLNGVLVKSKADIANGATFTENTNYEAKTVGEELSELNSNIPHKYDIWLDAVTANTRITKTINEVTQGEITYFDQLFGISIISAYGANDYDFGMKVIAGHNNNKLMFLPSVSQSATHVVLTLWFR